MTRSPLRLVLLRHGQSDWNKQRRLTGWADVGLSDHGKQQATNAAESFRQASYDFDEAYCSDLVRARDTLDIVLRGMRLTSLPVTYSWRLNERHYGALEGLGPLRSVFKFGLRHVIRCQRRFNVAPPLLTVGDPRYPGNQPRFSNVPPGEWPRGESMAQTLTRVTPLWDDQLAPAVLAGRRVLVVSHKNALRVLIKYVCGYSDQQAEQLAIRTAKPLVFEFDEQLRLIRDYAFERPSKARPRRKK